MDWPNESRALGDHSNWLKNHAMQNRLRFFLSLSAAPTVVRTTNVQHWISMRQLWWQLQCSNSWVLFKNCWDACGFCVTQFVSISYFACSPADYQFMLNWLSVFYERLIGVVAHKANLNFRVVTTTYLSALVEVGFNQIDYRLFQQIRVDLHQIKDWKRSSKKEKSLSVKWGTTSTLKFLHLDFTE